MKTVASLVLVLALAFTSACAPRVNDPAGVGEPAPPVSRSADTTQRR